MMPSRQTGKKVAISLFYQPSQAIPLACLLLLPQDHRYLTLVILSLHIMDGKEFTSLPFSFREDFFYLFCMKQTILPRNGQTVSLLRPFARLRWRTLFPPFVLTLAKKPCVFFLFLFFILTSFIISPSFRVSRSAIIIILDYKR